MAMTHGKTVKKKRKPSPAKAAAWGWMSKYIRKKSADYSGLARCVTCGVVKPWQELHAGHFVPKGRGLAVFFVEENIHPQCAACNTYKGGMLIEYTRYMQETYGPEIVDELLALAKTHKPMRLADYEAIEQHYREKFNELGKSGVHGSPGD